MGTVVKPITPRGIIKPVDRAAPTILRKAYGCLPEGILGPKTFLDIGSTTIVYRAALSVDGSEKRVALKSWLRDGSPGIFSLRVHNNYVVLAELKRRGVLKHMGVPKMYYSLVELPDGRVLICPADTVIDENIRGLAVIKNILLIVDDLTGGLTYHISEVRSRDDIPKELREPIMREIREIVKLMESYPQEQGKVISDVLEALFTIETVPPIVSMGDIDKLDPIIVPGIPVFEVDLGSNETKS